MGAVLFVLLLAAPNDLHKRAIDTFNRADFARAAELLQADVEQQIGKPEEKKAREMLVLALYNAAKLDDAVRAYHALLERFPEFLFNEDEVLPDTIAFFAAHPRKVAPAPPKPPPAAASQPVMVKQPAAEAPQKRFHWYYLAPLGVGQYLAGSPVRGTIFLVLQAGFLAMNLVGYYALYAPNQLADGKSIDAERARTGMLLTNIGFAGLLGSVIAGIVDAAAFERN